VKRADRDVDERIARLGEPLVVLKLILRSWSIQEEKARSTTTCKVGPGSLAAATASPDLPLQSRYKIFTELPTGGALRSWTAEMEGRIKATSVLGSLARK
jgi:hypothetical protein